MKTVAPGLSRQGFLRLLEQRTEQFGRRGKIHGDAFQRSFVEYTFCQFLCEKMANVEHFTCPACTPNMLAVSADGSRKLYRFQHSKGSEEQYFKGIFIAKDVDVSSFVEEIRSKAKSTVRKAEAESQRLENLSRELGCPENMVQQWVHDVRQWATDDSNKIRQMRRRKLGDEKRKLFEAIKRYNEQVPEEEGINEQMVESRLSMVGHASGEDSLIWPWEVHSTGSLTDEGHCGLQCLLQERLADVEEKIQVVSSRYSLALGPLFPEDWSEEIPEIPDESKGLEYESSEDSDLEDV
ncbi:hypothetical protein cypCar_00046864 [Cyprinus carpio]|nr:hypothetical protein cypCar_00046864 [Cyprinus carpio]